MSLHILLIVLALASFICAAFGVTSRVGWRDLGFAFLTLSLLI